MPLVLLFFFFSLLLFNLTQELILLFITFSVSRPRIGVVEELELFDFMNHNNFYMKFHPNVNFIVGYNGAGKSAILAGIRVGLGATAKVSCFSLSLALLC